MNASATLRDRILTAARGEFSAHGVAGARVDRIAAAAKTSKERVYAYFRSKDELYAAVTDQRISAVVAGVSLDLGDVPRYVGELFDFFVAHPEQLRLSEWGRLEAVDVLSSRGDDVLTRKLQAIADAQLSGLITDEIPALDVLVLIRQLASGWLVSTEYHGLADPADPAAVAAHRAAAVWSATRLFPPRGASGQ